MSGKVWFSRFMSDYRIGNKQGLRTKFRGEEWEPPQHMFAAESDKVYAAARKHSQGYSLTKDDLPEAVAVWDNKSFSKVGELFIAGRFYAVKKRLADVFENFDLGVGGLIPFNIYDNDLITPLKEQFYYLNFGARKKSFLPKESRKVDFIASDPQTGLGLWRLSSDVHHGDILVSADALSGADLWAEEEVTGSLFFSERLASALTDINSKTNFNFVECRVMACPRSVAYVRS